MKCTSDLTKYPLPYVELLREKSDILNQHFDVHNDSQMYGSAVVSRASLLVCKLFLLNSIIFHFIFAMSYFLQIIWRRLAFVVDF